MNANEHLSKLSYQSCHREASVLSLPRRHAGEREEGEDACFRLDAESTKAQRLVSIRFRCQSQEYLDAAVAYLDSDDSQLGVTDIRGIWVASDEAGVVDSIKEIAPSYLPNVEDSAIVWASGGVEGGPKLDRTATRTDKEVKRKRKGCSEIRGGWGVSRHRERKLKIGI